MRKSLEMLLEELLAASLQCGLNERDLNPGIDAAEFAARAAWFPFPIHDEVRKLYSWRNGNRELYNQTEYFRFGDETFFSIEYAHAEYLRMIECWTADTEELMDINEELGFDLRTGFPFAGLHGSYLLLNPANGEICRLYCGAERRHSSLEDLIQASLSRQRKRIENGNSQ